MKRMSFEKLVALLQENGVTPDEMSYYNDEYGQFWELINGEYESKPTKEGKELSEKLGKFSVVDEHGGGEGEGEDCHRIFYFESHDVYLKIEGWYASYDGSSYENDPTEVRPKEVMVTQYHDITQEEKRDLKIGDVVDVVDSE